MCQTVRYENKKGIRARASFHPEWSEENPWVTYINGDAGLHLPTLEAVDKYFQDRGFKRVESDTAEKRKPLYNFKIGDFVKDTAGTKFEIVEFHNTEVTLLDSFGERSYAHPLYPMEPWSEYET